MAVWWTVSAVGLLVVIPLVLVLAARLMRTAWEIRRYAEDIRSHALGLSEQLGAVPELARTRELAAQVQGAAVSYVAALDRLVAGSRAGAR